MPPEPSDRRLRLIGIGAGDPRLLTLEAAEALGRADVVLTFDKRAEVDELAALRRALLAEHAPRCRVVGLPDPERDLSGDGPYARAVAGWHAQRVELLSAALAVELVDGGTAALLVWGDPSLYDSSLRLVAEVAPLLPWPVVVDVLPGVSSLHLLTARHAIPLNRVGAAVRITTARRLAEAPPDASCDVVVFLDKDGAFTDLDDEHLDIYWGAYLGTADELLVAGPLRECKDEILRVRTEARARKGWLFDTYLLRWTG